MSVSAPAGTFFRIRQAAFGYVKVALRETGKRFGSWEVEYVTVYPGDFPNGADAIEEAKRRVVKQYERNHADRRKLNEALKFEGDSE